jgi:hypothetical protein
MSGNVYDEKVRCRDPAGADRDEQTEEQTEKET